MQVEGSSLTQTGPREVRVIVKVSFGPGTDSRTFKLHYEQHDGDWMLSDRDRPDFSRKDGTWPLYMHARAHAGKVLQAWIEGDV